ncbi:hypothetical protein ACFRFQ_14445 [Rhodococcus sp. NPDC056743]|uniref:hypothetical protein n=1 Tax=Rhodococcus sp. NPDC056743 TaxID=3345934 RepID=UPI0036727C87
MNTFQKSAAAINKVVLAAMRVPVINKVIGGSTAQITYTGRKSGKTFTLPVSYRQRNDEVLIRVALPQKKNWWRNFLNEGGQMHVKIRGIDRTGHAVSTRDEKGNVSVKVSLDPVS